MLRVVCGVEFSVHSDYQTYAQALKCFLGILCNLPAQRSAKKFKVEGRWNIHFKMFILQTKI